MNEETKNYIDQKIREHYHNGLDSGLLKLENIFGFIRTMDTVPAHTPRNLFEQFVIYKSGATLLLYVYDVTNNAWRNATLV